MTNSDAPQLVFDTYIDHLGVVVFPTLGEHIALPSNWSDSAESDKALNLVNQELTEAGYMVRADYREQIPYWDLAVPYDPDLPVELQVATVKAKFAAAWGRHVQGVCAGKQGFDQVSNNWPLQIKDDNCDHDH